MGTIGDLSNLDPFFMTFNNYPMMENVYDQFVRLDNKVQMHPAIIQEWTTSPSGLTITLKVRQGVKYHDGSTATAEDVVKCIKRAATAETGGHQYTNWVNLKDVGAKGNDIVEVTLKQVSAYLLPALGLISLIQPSAFDALKSKEGGSGPFMVKEWIPNDYLELAKFPAYWETGRPLLDSARVKFFQDAAALVAALEAGTIDIAMSVPPSEYARLKGKLNMVLGQEAANFYYFGMNTKYAPFDKKEVRQAVAFAVDKDTICQNVLFGLSKPIDLPWPEWSFAYDARYKGMYRYDLDEAKKRLAAAGYPNGITFKLLVSTAYPEFVQMAQIIKASLAKIGCTVNIEPMDNAQFVPLAQKGEVPSTISFAGGTQWYPTRIALSTLYRLSNNTYWPDGIPPKGWIDGLTKADATFEPEEQKAAIKQAVATFMDEMWSLPIAFRYTLFGLQNYVKGFANGIYDQPRLREVTVSK
jgi:peptide/nickel transport system substrate-binding protein